MGLQLWAVHAALATDLLLQTGGDVIDPWAGVTGAGGLGSATFGFLATLVVGGLLVAVAPSYVERNVAAVADEPFECLAYGIVTYLVAVVVAIALVFTLVGIVVVIPLVLVLAIAGVVGNVIGFLAVADRLIGTDGGWTTPVVAAACINAALAFTSVGGVIGLAISAVGFGAVVRDWRRDDGQHDASSEQALGAGVRGRR